MFRIIRYCLLTFLIYAGFLNGQVSYEMSLKNAELVDQYTIEFDVFMKASSTSFELTSYQCAFSFHKTIKNGGNLTFSYINGSSGLSNAPTVGVGVKTEDGDAELAFASMPGSDMITATQVKVGRFRLQNSNPYGIYTARIINLTWDFSGTIETILTGTGFSNITVPANHISEIESFSMLNIVQVTAVDTINPIQNPMKTIDGKGFYDGDVNSKWVSQPAPKWIVYNLGSQLIVNLLRFSFYNFEQGREYIYSVQVSNDMNEWTEVVTNDTSDLIEWTDKLVNPVTAQYVKLIMHSNNQDQWAILWETEIWAGDQSIPVELTSFTGLPDENKIILNWSTASEMNNMGFEIQRLQDKNEELPEWHVIGFISGSGTSAEVQNYSFSDENLVPGFYSYRLKQIDYNGNFIYSNEIEVELINTLTDYQLFQNYPNPFNPETNIRFTLPRESKVKLAVFNILGEQVTELINSVMQQGKHEVSFNAINLASGVYLYRLDIENGFSDMRKMVLLR
jgi:hypothetical protein